jgi:hypothetical protein
MRGETTTSGASIANGEATLPEIAELQGQTKSATTVERSGMSAGTAIHCRIGMAMVAKIITTEAEEETKDVFKDVKTCPDAGMCKDSVPK